VFEFHGWAVICESTIEIDNGNLQNITSTLKTLVDDIKWYQFGFGFASADYYNGKFIITTNGNAKRAYRVPQLFSLFQKIAEIAPGSYGLLYIWDHESGDNEFAVWVLAKGSFKKHNDTLLSPCIPVIEDDVP